MNKTVLISVVIGIVVLSAVALLLNSSSSDNSSPQQTVQNDQSSGQVQDIQNPSENNSNQIEDLSVGQGESRYVEYTPEKFSAAAGKKRVYFFHASWCPTCKAANSEFTNNLSKIPEEVVLFKTDYDTEDELKDKYNITYQHTFVYVDEQGNEIAKWNGGVIDELIANVQ